MALFKKKDKISIKMHICLAVFWNTKNFQRGAHTVMVEGIARLG